jgi:hypothetical protein
MRAISGISGGLGARGLAAGGGGFGFSATSSGGGEGSGFGAAISTGFGGSTTSGIGSGSGSGASSIGGGVFSRSTISIGETSERSRSSVLNMANVRKKKSRMAGD